MDIIWLAKNSQGAFTRIITIILLISKVRARTRGHHQNMLMLSHRYRPGWHSPTAYVKREAPLVVSISGVAT